VPDDHLCLSDVDHFLPELIYHGAAMLSEAKHLRSSRESRSATDQRFFASLRMTFYRWCNGP
jgi:hypothetical protein